MFIIKHLLAQNDQFAVRLGYALMEICDQKCPLEGTADAVGGGVLANGILWNEKTLQNDMRSFAEVLSRGHDLPKFNPDARQ